MEKLKSLSVFFPAYNEEANVERMVNGFKAVLPLVAEGWEIIIINDGSRDRTGEIADRLANEDPKVRVVHHGKNQGYGTAVRSGIHACRMEHLFFTDGDGQFDVSQLSKLIPYLSDYDGVIGYRLSRQDPWIRKFNAWAWNRLVRFLLGLRVRDIDCAFKLFRREIFDQVQLEYTGAMISTEMLVKIRKRGYNLYEIGVLHSPRMAGKQTGANPRAILMAFKELFSFYKKMKEER